AEAVIATGSVTDAVDLDLGRAVVLAEHQVRGLGTAVGYRTAVLLQRPEPGAVARHDHGRIGAAVGHVHADAGQGWPRWRGLRPALLRRPHPGGRDHLPGVVLATDLEVAVQELRTQRFRQGLQRGAVPRDQQVRVVHETGRNEGPRLGLDRLALVRERLAIG